MSDLSAAAWPPKWLPAAVTRITVKAGPALLALAAKRQLLAQPKGPVLEKWLQPKHCSASVPRSQRTAACLRSATVSASRMQARKASRSCCRRALDATAEEEGEFDEDEDYDDMM